MISIDEAYNLISSHAKDFGTEKVHFFQSLNRILATEIKADRDFPPFDRVTMDGIAINSKAFEAGQRKFIIEKTSAAGSPVQALEKEEHCIEVMTGTVLPLHTDAVIPYEQCDITGSIARVNTDEIKSEPKYPPAGN